MEQRMIQELIDGLKEFDKAEANLKDDRLKESLNIILQKIAEIYRVVYGINLVKVVMYGSYARGDYDRDSDVDIVAIVKGDRVELQEQLKQVWDVSSELELEYDTIVSPTVIPYDEYKKYQEDIPYYRNIAQEGVEVIA